MRRVAIIGGGPAGLMAAEQLSTVDGLQVDIFEAMPSLGRKFLMAGKGGMNITHAEPLADFIRRYGERAAQLAPCLLAFGPAAVREWIHGLGIETFVGTSGRVFPTGMKAAPLLRAWLHRLRQRGVRIHVRHRWLGWGDAGALRFATPDGEMAVFAASTVLALGGGSWSRLGSDGRWVPLLRSTGLPVADLQPANCGFEVAWSDHFRQRFAGAPVKAVIAACGQRQQQGEFNITETGVEGGLIYALSAPLREALARGEQAVLQLDLAPGRSLARLSADLALPQGRDTLANHLRRRAGIDGVKAGLLREFFSPAQLTVATTLAAAIKALPLVVQATRPLDEAISSAGGLDLAALNDQGMVVARPGLFCAGEMLDWEAPTGGYLLTACLATGWRAGRGVRCWLGETR
ncbi:MAG: TIGR03862 family flavoprotein [Dechloromonas sp.]|nr:TIGR03862 family flavoprotein [Dechloromonas sp.]